MTESFNEKAEEQELFRRNNNSGNQQNMILQTSGSAGNNSEKLARILSAFDIFIVVMKYEEKPIAKLSGIISQYQGSVDAQYHNDLKAILIAEEIERRRSERKGISILQQ